MDPNANSGGGVDWASIIQLTDSDLMAWYALTHSNTPMYNQPGISVGPAPGGGIQGTAGLSSLVILGVIAIAAVLILK